MDLHSPNQDEQQIEVQAVQDADAIMKAEHKRLFQRGTKWLCAGLLLMGMSFLVNFMLFHSDISFNTAMYLITSAGGVCMIKGLADMVGF